MDDATSNGPVGTVLDLLNVDHIPHLQADEILKDTLPDAWQKLSLLHSELIESPDSKF